MSRKNLGPLDRDLRLVLVAVFGLIALFAPFGGLWQIIPAVLALLMLITAGLAYCPIYALFGIDTRNGRAKEEVRRQES